MPREQVASKPELDTILRGLLGPSVGAELLSLSHEQGVMTATFSVDGQEVRIEWWGNALERRALHRGQVLSFAYRQGNAVAGELRLVERLIAVLLKHEQDLAPFIGPLIHPDTQPVYNTGRQVFVREQTLVVRVLAALPQTRSLRAAVTRLLHEELGPNAELDEFCLYLQNPCVQSCEFCEEPILRRRPAIRVASRVLRLQQTLALDLVSTGILDALLSVLATWRTRARLKISGNDWLRFPHLDGLLSALERHPSVPLRFQGPSLGLSSEPLLRRVAALPSLECIAMTLQSSDADEHDAMLGLPGGHAQLMGILDHLEALSAPYVLTLVLTRRALRSLPATLSWLASRRRRIQMNAFIPDRGLGEASDRLAPLEELRRALEQTRSDGHERITTLVGVPYCAVPPSLRHKVVPALRTSEQDTLTFASACSRCSLRTRCSGVPAGYLHAFGTRGVTPVE